MAGAAFVVFRRNRFGIFAPSRRRRPGWLAENFYLNVDKQNSRVYSDMQLIDNWVYQIESHGAV